MKNLKTILFAFVIALFCAATVTSASAQGLYNKKTKMTFSEPVEIPGQILPAGTYWFKLVDSDSNRNIVRITNEDESQVIATVIAINNYKLHTSGNTVVRFSEKEGDQPPALKAWFYPGDNYGQEFAYPKHRASELQAAMSEPVPSYPDATTPDTVTTAPITPIETPAPPPEPTPAPVEATPAPEPTPAPATATDTATPPATTDTTTTTPDMPKTGSAIPLVALLGLASLGVAAGMKRAAN